jgi:hypothetical protein
MATIAEVSKLINKSWDERPNHRLIIAGEDVSNQLKSISITYTTDGGGSGAQIEMNGSLVGFDNAPIEFQVGYGDDTIPYFNGRIQRPTYNHRLDITTTNAFGPFKLMSDQILEQEISYLGRTLSFALSDLITKAGYGLGETEIIGGHEKVIDTDEVFPFFNSLNDTANSLLESCQFVGVDQPGGKRVFKKKPRPGVNGAAVTRYGASEYAKDSFTADPKTEFGFYKVIVQRVSKQGDELTRHEAIVKRQSDFPAPLRRAHVVDGFVGTTLEAAQEAEDIARFLRAGDLGFSIVVPTNPTLMLYDVIEVERVHRGLRYVYGCVINGEINVEYRPATKTEPGVNNMTLTGDAVPIIEGQSVPYSTNVETVSGDSVVVNVGTSLLYPQEGLFPSDTLYPR